MVQRSLSFGKQQLCTTRITPVGESVGEPRPANTAYAGVFQSGVKGLPKGAVVGLLLQISFFSLALHTVKQRERHALFQITQFTRFSHSWVVLC